MNVEILSPADVPDVYTNRLEHRPVGERALVTTMTTDFADNPVVDALVKYGQEEDIFAPDYFSYLHGASPSPMFHRSAIDRDHKASYERFITEFPGSLMLLNTTDTPNLLRATFQGRSHIKAYAIGQKVISLGGVNCTNDGFFKKHDVMLDFESDVFVDFMDRFIARDGDMREDGPGERFKLDEDNEVLVDYGQKGESVILKSVLDDLGS